MRGRRFFCTPTITSPIDPEKGGSVTGRRIGGNEVQERGRIRIFKKKCFSLFRLGSGIAALEIATGCDIGIPITSLR